MRVLGLDLGTKTIGIALSDEVGITAQPVKTLRRKGTKADIEELLEFMDSNDVNTIVVGLPVNMNGTMGTRSEEVLVFVERLKGYTDLPVVMWDERLSTVAVTRVLIEGDMSRKKRKRVVDKMAAAYILQGYLDSRRPGTEG
jgi:putative Holliday junction resolvase